MSYKGFSRKLFKVSEDNILFSNILFLNLKVYKIKIMLPNSIQCFILQLFPGSIRIKKSKNLKAFWGFPAE